MFKGKKVALITSGGGGRGIAHAGVIRACEKMGIEFDILIGVSAGAIGAVLYSINKDSDKIVDNFRPFWKRKYKFPTFGWGRMLTMKGFFKRNITSGLFDLEAAQEFLKKSLPVDNFNDLPIPTYIAATSLERHDGVMFGPGINDHVPISKALMASCCIPILFRPVEIDGEHYVDGEIKRPLSIETAIELGAEIVIVSDIYSPHVDGIGNSNMFNIGSQIANMLLGDKSLRGIKICKAKYPDREIILISPPVGNISALNTYAWEKLERTGYNTAIKVLREYESNHGPKTDGKAK